MDLTTNNLEEENFVYEAMQQPQLGNHIKESRKAKKLTQRQLGEKLDVSYQTIAYWESGSRTPTFANLLRLAMALDKPDDFFLCRVPEQKTKTIVSTLCDNLRHYRSIFDLSQTKLSELTKIPLATIRAYEDKNSGQFITNSNLKLLCDYFGVEREDLLGRSCTAEDLQEQMEENYRNEINAALETLNMVGLEKAAERLSEMAELRRYRK